jgi:hypothetical protein
MVILELVAARTPPHWPGLELLRNRQEEKLTFELDEANTAEVNLEKVRLAKETSWS